jgi:hypothetical protein
MSLVASDWTQGLAAGHPKMSVDLTLLAWQPSPSADTS